ncbi:hypothetical protein [Streptomyces pseudovenezuelae]|uniref:hypothetical protein n=1 Tax=Streptomyces pseudovenezuelae TaxID=67350 RepID=UPI002E804363|nr:hypothetical protein [Streptomyces pseudovenezuelae]WUA94511.1 hypothetical protein OHO81_44865 [Streptomyces pseudovenezuelae]
MTTPSPDPTLTAVRIQACEAWQVFTRSRSLPATLTDWTTTKTPDGTPALTAMATGPDAEQVLRAFTADFHIRLTHSGDTRQCFDFSVPGRTACVRRSRGVWVQLWVPDSPGVAVAPVQAARRRVLARPGARLPFTRNRRAKEAHTA